MPELPEVHTTVEGLKKKIVGLSIIDVWSGYRSDYKHYKDQIKNPSFFTAFKKNVLAQKIIAAERRHKNILVHLENSKTILIHLKMTGHLLYGTYKQTGARAGESPWDKEEWEPIDANKNLRDPFNRFVRLVFSLSNGKHLALSDMRRFAKVTMLNSGELRETSELKDLGPEPLEKDFTFEVFREQILQKSSAPIKTVLTDPTIIAGIGNIYSDEILWSAGVHPESRPLTLPDAVLKKIYKNIKPILKKGIDFGGDSMSDYRDITGARGNFQNHHNVYRKTGSKCGKHDGGIIERKVVRGRSAHFCPEHQIKY